MNDPGSQASNAPEVYRPSGWRNWLADVPTLSDELIPKLRDSRITGVLATEEDEQEASKQIAASCRALREKFAEVSGGRWTDGGDE